MSYQTVSLACPELPLPCKNLETGELGSISRLQIKSRLSPAKAIGHLHRNYPTFSLTNTFLKMLRYASETVEKPGSSPVLALIGEMGAGKTSSAELAMSLVDGVSPEKFDCGEQSLDWILFEPQLSSGSKGPIEELERKFNKGEMNPLNEALIKKEFSYAIGKDEDGKSILDLSLIKTEDILNAVETIKTVISLEGIGNSNAIGISYKEGPLIRAWKAAERAEKTGEPHSGRLIIDEIDKRLPNTGRSLQQVWLVLGKAGGITKHTVKKDGIEFTFDANKIPKGFSVIITGNDNRDITSSLGESSGLSTSMASRFTIYSIEKPQMEDLTNRICQTLCGMPLLMADILPEKDPTNWQKLQDLRTLGTDDPLTEEESWLLKHYDKTLTAARQLASFYIKWGELVDPDNQEIDDPILESTTAFREPPSVRMAQKHIRRAISNDILNVSSQQAVPCDNPIEKLLSHKEDITEALKGLGERIEKVVMEEIQLSAGGPETKAKILQIAKAEGLIYEPDEENNPNKHKKLIRDLLSTDKDTFVVEKETKNLQVKLYNQFIERYKHIFKDKTPSMDDLIPIRDLQSSLNQLREIKERKTTARTTYMLNINPQYIEGNKTEKAIECIPVLFRLTKEAREELEKYPKEELHSALMDSEIFLTLVSTPKVGEETLESLWNEGWHTRLSEMIEDNVDEERPDFVDAMSGKSKDFRVAKVLTKGADGKPETTLVFDSPALKKTWLLRNEIKEEIIKRGIDPISGEDDKPNDKSKAKGQYTIKTLPKSKIPQLLEELSLELPNNSFEHLEVVLAPFTGPDDDKTIEQTIEEALEPRSQQARMPMRLPNIDSDGRTDNRQTTKNEQTTQKKTKKTLEKVPTID
jgi:hypothetical protein